MKDACDVIREGHTCCFSIDCDQDSIYFVIDFENVGI